MKEPADGSEKGRKRKAGIVPGAQNGSILIPEKGKKAGNLPLLKITKRKQKKVEGGEGLLDAEPGKAVHS